MSFLFDCNTFLFLEKTNLDPDDLTSEREKEQDVLKIDL